MNYVVTHREVLVTRYLVTGVDDEDDFEFEEAPE